MAIRAGAAIQSVPVTAARVELPVAGELRVHLHGVLGDALTVNESGRLSHLIDDGTSPPLAIFGPEHADENRRGDWYGEHAGKWLYAASKAARRNDDPELAGKVQRAADFLLSVQKENGYLGTYAEDHRFTAPQPSAERTWDGAPGQRTWDIWTHSYLVLGLLEADRILPGRGYGEAAQKIGDLVHHTLTQGGVDITTLGNHFGMSATVMLDPAAELYAATGDPKYLELAEKILAQANARPELALLDEALQGTDAANIATGKAYQLSWNLVGLAKLYRATQKPAYLDAVLNLWKSIRENHLTLGGGPWGGVAHRSREVFNPAGVFDPHGYVETCSTLSWIQLNRELLELTDDPRFAQEVERSAYNDLLGAQSPDGHDWLYYSFPNGKRVYTTEWRCCKSSGAMALEELPEIAYTRGKRGEVSVNLYGPSKATVPLTDGTQVHLEQRTRYPFGGRVQVEVNPESAARFALRLRIPDWAEGARVSINGVPAPEPTHAGSFLTLERGWKPGDEVSLDFPMRPVLHEQTSRNVQESLAPDGSPVAQEVMHRDYVAVTRGPLVHTLAQPDSLEDSLRIPASGVELSTLPPAKGTRSEGVQLRAGGKSLDFVPYIEAGDRADGTWRQTWVQVSK